MAGVGISEHYKLFEIRVKNKLKYLYEKEATTLSDY